MNGNIRILLETMGFSLQDNTSEKYYKRYSSCNDYILVVDFKQGKIDYGKLIKSENKSTQNFSQDENWVVLECVNRLLEKGYNPQNIVLEKTYPSGHGTSGRLDICVTRNDGTEYLLIECKTWGKEFKKEFSRLKKDGGQLFTYFKFKNQADIIVLYESRLNGSQIQYHNEIIKIEDDYRSGGVKDFHEKWNKLTKDNGVFDSWVNPYSFISKALTPKALKTIKEEDSGFIFNRFLEILRHNVVSDKPNAFNKIFTLFLCKVYDEKTTSDDEELKFQWLEGIDDDVTFQLRLTDLYKNGMKEFLEKDVTDFSKDDFEKKYHNLGEDVKKDLLREFDKIRLEKNNEFAIKEVFDNQSFIENAKIVKEVVELLQGYRLRYNKRQQYLSDFFEMLLTTGLKQESGQFFTPVPIAHFIIKSLPLNKIVNQKLGQGTRNQLLPYIMDFAAGSGHFLTESMHEIQGILNTIEPNSYLADTAKKIRTWQDDHFDWATKYVYGIEKDYRLVKVGKVGCYLHGDGLANVILSDGLASFSSKDYKGILKKTDDDFTADNKQFDIVISNPPYSVASFKNASREYYSDKDFELYNRLTDNSSEIECLFIERTKQLLKDDGLAGIILPSSILSNTGIYTQAREIILKYFEIVAIAELGSNTFMATGTNTVILFLRRKDNYRAINLRESVQRFFENLQDVTINGIESPVSKYLRHVWNDILLEDYISLLQKNPNPSVLQHDIYKDYKKNIQAKTDEESLAEILKIEEEKLFYFILAYPQKTVIVKTGTKKEEKQFLGYEFSNRRGNEGIHPIERGKTIAACTKLFDENKVDNPQKASTYIYKAFNGDFDFDIDQSLQKNIVRANLVDLMTFDRTDFEKNISLNVNKKINYVDIYKTTRLVLLGEIANIQKGKTITQAQATTSGNIPVIAGGKEPSYCHNEYNRDGNIVTVSASGAYAGYINYFSEPIFASDCNTVVSKDESLMPTKLIFFFLQKIQKSIYSLQRGQAQPHVYGKDLSNIQIPLPPPNVQKQIVLEIDAIEQEEIDAKHEIEKLKSEIEKIVNSIFMGNYPQRVLGDVAEIKNGGTPDTNKPEYWDGNINWATLVDTKEKYLTNTARKISEEGLKHSSAVLLPINTVIFSSRATIGDVSIAKIPVATNQGYKNFICDPEQLNYEFLYYILKHETKNIENLASGMTYNEISKNKIARYSIPVPNTIAEQEKIVSHILTIETKITELTNKQVTLFQKKQSILDKYLNQ